MQYLYVGIGGCIGAILRFGIGELVSSQWNYDFPLATLLINCVGSFCLGWISIYLLRRKVSLLLQQSICIGLIGSFTTFSAFSVEFVQLIKEGHEIIAMIYFLVSLLLGLLLAWLGNATAVKNNKQVKN